MTKGLLIASVASSIIVQTASRAARRRVPYLVDAFTHAFVFRNPGELMVGTLLAYFFRIFERQMGSGKFGAYTVVTCSIAYTIQAALASILSRPSASGLYPLIFANLVTFFLEVPPLQKFNFFGIALSDKIFVYLAGLQLLFSSSQRSLAAGLSGVLAGTLYSIDFLGLRRFRVRLIAKRSIKQAQYLASLWIQWHMLGDSPKSFTAHSSFSCFAAT